MSGFDKINDMNYRVADDGEFTTIFKTDEAPDDFSIFTTLSKAKQHAKRELRDQIHGLRQCIQKIKLLKEDDLEID